MTILFVPSLMAPLGIALIWRYLLNTELGMLNQLARVLGLAEQAWLTIPTSALWTTVLINVWQFTPFVFLILLAGIRALPVDPYQAARIDGASSFQMFRFITLPLLKPILMVAVVFRVTDGFRLFDLIWGLTAGGPGTSTFTMTLAVYRQAFFMYDLGYASTIAVMLLIAISVFAGVALKALHSESVV